MSAPGFAGWTRDRLAAYGKHLEALLIVSAGQGDPDRAEIRAEHAAVHAEIKRKDDVT
jgi:hypothetical protein